MRTKTLLLAAAITAAGASASMAQVYSVNAVGYVNVSVPGGKLEILANPLNGTNNGIGTILPLSEAGDGAAVYAFDVPSQNYVTENFFGGGTGWLPGTTVLPPGDGFFIQAPNGPDLNITFVGEVPQGTLVTGLSPANQLSLKGSMVPQSARLGNDSTAGTLLFPSEDADAAFTWDVTSQGYKTDNYFEGTGWLGDSGDLNGPLIAVGHGFFLQKSSTATKTSWSRTFSVNP